MKVAIVSSSFRPREVGGTETYLSMIADGLSELVELIVLTGPLSTKSNLSSYRESLTVREIRLGGRYPIWEWSDHWLGSRALWHFLDLRDRAAEQQIVDLLREEKPDVVHTHNVRGLSLSTLQLPARMGIPHVHTLHDFLLLSPLSNLSLGGLILTPRLTPNRIYQSVTRALTKTIGNVISPSQYLLDEHTKMGFFEASQKHLLRMPRPSITRTDETNSPAPPGVITTHPRPWFLYVGIIEKSKGVRILLDAIRRVRDLRATFIVVGEGRLRPVVQKYAGNDDRVKFLGRVRKDELLWLYRNCDILVFPSLWPENAPMVLYEALSHGLAVIASKIGGVPEIVTRNGGTLVEPGSVAELTSALMVVIRHHTTSATGERHEAKLQSLPTLDQHVDKLLQVYKLAVESRV